MPLGYIPLCPKYNELNPVIDLSELSYRGEMALIPCHHHYLGLNNKKQSRRMYVDLPESVQAIHHCVHGVHICVRVPGGCLSVCVCIQINTSNPNYSCLEAKIQTSQLNNINWQI